MWDCRDGCNLWGWQQVGQKRKEEKEREEGRENQERVRGLFSIFPCRFQQLQYLESTGAKPQQAVTICPRFIVTQEPFATKPW